jgi:hypothetical protein
LRGFADDDFDLSEADAGLPADERGFPPVVRSLAGLPPLGLPPLGFVERGLPVLLPCEDGLLPDGRDDAAVTVDPLRRSAAEMTKATRR